MDDEDNFLFGEMAVIDSEELDSMLEDLNYWITATAMLSDILVANNIDHEVTDKTVMEYLKQVKEDEGI